MIGDIFWFLSLAVVSAYSVFLLVSYFLFRKMETKEIGPVSKTVAVVIAARNEEANISALLKALESQETEMSFEVIVVDDHSEDQTFLLAQKHWPKKFRLSVLHNGGAGKKDALTTGIQSTLAEVILVTDADCIPDTKWLAAMTSEFNDPMCCFAAGMIAPVSTEGVIGATLATETVFLQVSSAGLFATGNAVMCNGASMAFTRKFFTDVNGFTNDLFVSGDDALLLQKATRFASGGIRWVKNRDAMVNAPVAKTIPEAISQRHRWLSKAKGYSNPVQTVIGVLFLAVQLLLPAALCAELLGFWDNPFLLALGLKIAVELLLLSLAASFFRETNVIIMLPATMVVYCIISLGAVFRLFGSDVKWKGRNWKAGRVR